MMRKGFLWALGVVLAANAFVLAGVAYNRSGTPDARLTLTARELPMAWGMGGYGKESENTGISLRLMWQVGATEWAVLNRAKLESLGFRFPPRAHHKDLLDRKAYAVFEYNGDAWAALLKEKQTRLAKSLAEAKTDNDRKYRQEEFDRFEKSASRLVLVDAGLDPAALRARYAERGKYLIAKVKVNAYAAYPGAVEGIGRDGVYGHVTLLSGAVYVPREFHALIKSANSAPRQPTWPYNPESGDVPAYQVTLAYGRRYEPWVEEVVGR